jgi:hypothetical protein
LQTLTDAIAGAENTHATAGADKTEIETPAQNLRIIRFPDIATLWTKVLTKLYLPYGFHSDPFTFLYKASRLLRWWASSSVHPA